MFESISSAPPVAMGVCAFAIAGVGSLLPVSPVEPLLVGVAMLAPKHAVLPLVGVITVAHMLAKAAVYAGSRKAQSTLTGRKRQMLDSLQRRLAGRRRLQMVSVLASAAAGLPPFYVVTVACGALGVSMRAFLLAGTIGRGLRFAAIVLLPRLFT